MCLGFLRQMQCASLHINHSPSKMGVLVNHKLFFFFLLTLAMGFLKRISFFLTSVGGLGDLLLTLYKFTGTTWFLGELYVKYQYVILMYNSLENVYDRLRLLTAF